MHDKNESIVNKKIENRENESGFCILFGWREKNIIFFQFNWLDKKWKKNK